MSIIEQAPPSRGPVKPPSAVASEPDRQPWSRFTRALRRNRTLLTSTVVCVVAVGIAWHYDFFRGRVKAEAGALTEPVTRGDLVVTVTEDGNLESSSNLDVKCEVAGGSTILWLVKDGSHINAGDELVRLDSALIEEQVNTQKIAYEKAQATRIEAERLFSASKIAVQEFVEGTYSQQLQICEGNITIALENLRSAENTYQYTERMTRKGYVPSLQRDSAAFAVEKAKLDLATARTAKDVLERFTRAKTVEDLESKRDTAEAKMRAEEAAFSLEEGKLKRLQGLLEKCTITAPRDGMVIYANETSSGRGGQQTVTIEEGAAVRERQSIIRLPDLDHMQVKVTVHESKVERLRVGMRASIRIQGATYQGTVASIANQAEPTSWFTANVKEFATIVKIDDDEIPHDGVRQLKPGMTASVEILVDHRKDVLSVPLEAVAEERGQTYCCVKSGGSVDVKPVVLGQNNIKSVEVKSGLNEGDEVLLNPRPYLGTVVADGKSERSVDVKQRDGEAPREAPIGAANGPSPPSGKSGGRGNLMQYDSNHDGKVSRDEAPEQVARNFDRIDENHDGFIDAKEQAASAARRKQREAAGGGPPGT